MIRVTAVASVAKPVGWREFPKHHCKAIPATTCGQSCPKLSQRLMREKNHGAADDSVACLRRSCVPHTVWAQQTACESPFRQACNLKHGLCIKSSIGNDPWAVTTTGVLGVGGGRGGVVAVVCGLERSCRLNVSR